MKIDNLVGKTFGKLKLIKIGDPYITPGGQKKTVWFCECSCGNPELIPVTATHLKSGHTTSCGCEKIRITKENNSRQNEYDLSGEYGIGYTRNTNVPFLFDLDDYDKIKKYCWREDCTKNGYITARDKNKKGTYALLLHRLVMNCPDGLQVDHIYHNVRDNRKSKLRIVTPGQNNYNRLPYEDGRIRGVYLQESGRWKAQITFEGVCYNLGVYDTKEEAIEARKKGEEKYFGEYAYKEENDSSSS